MYPQRLINLENRTQTREKNLYSDRLLNLEKEMEKQKSSSEEEKTSAIETSNMDVKDEPPDFLDELLESAEQIAQAAAPTKQKEEVKPEPSANDDEEIDPNFFDELLQRAEVERREEVPVVNLKRERTNKDASGASIKKKSKDDDPRTEDLKPRLQVRSDLGLFPNTTKTARIDPIRESLLFMDEEMLDETPDKEAEKRLTAQEKMSKALERILYAKRAFEKERIQKEKKFYPRSPVFVYTQTVRKLPSSSTHFTQQIYDNRSPLHTVNNVSFSFNSTTTRLNLHDWGIEAPPQAALKVAQALSYDAETLYLKRNSIKIPDKIQKSQNTGNDADALFEQTSSTLFINATVQTDDVRIVPVRRGDFYRNVGIQYNPQTIVVGTQTSSAYCGNTVSDLPLMRSIGNLNENQLQAVDDFVQLITEPVGLAGIDIYEKRSRLHDIYKVSQQPSLFSSSMPPVPPPPSMRGYGNNDYNRSEIKHEFDRDPRYNLKRGRPSSYQGGHLDPVSSRSGWNASPTLSNSSTKYYGRGGKRR